MMACRILNSKLNNRIQYADATCASKLLYLVTTETATGFFKCRQSLHLLSNPKLLVKVVDSCRIFLTKWSDTFRSFFVHGKEQESQKNMSYPCKRNSPFLFSLFSNDSKCRKIMSR